MPPLPLPAHDRSNRRRDCFSRSCCLDPWCSGRSRGAPDSPPVLCAPAAPVPAWLRWDPVPEPISIEAAEFGCCFPKIHPCAFSGLLRKSWESPEVTLAWARRCRRHLAVPVPGTSPARALAAGLGPHRLLFLAGHQQLHDQQHSCQPAPGHPAARGPRQPVRVPHWQGRLQDQGDPRGAWCPARGGSRVPKGTSQRCPHPGDVVSRGIFGALCIFSAWHADTQLCWCCPSQLEGWGLAPPPHSSWLPFPTFWGGRCSLGRALGAAALTGRCLGLGYGARLGPGPLCRLGLLVTESNPAGIKALYFGWKGGAGGQFWPCITRHGVRR